MLDSLTSSTRPANLSTCEPIVRTLTQLHASAPVICICAVVAPAYSPVACHACNLPHTAPSRPRKLTMLYCRNQPSVQNTLKLPASHRVGVCASSRARPRHQTSNFHCLALSSNKYSSISCVLASATPDGAAFVFLPTNAERYHTLHFRVEDPVITVSSIVSVNCNVNLYPAPVDLIPNCRGHV
jgi:hypothetical protein